jgi:hypothetical protein
LEASVKVTESKLDEHLKKFAAVQKNADAGNDNAKNNLSRIKALEQAVKVLSDKVKKLEQK